MCAWCVAEVCLRVRYGLPWFLAGRLGGGGAGGERVVVRHVLPQVWAAETDCLFTGASIIQQTSLHLTQHQSYINLLSPLSSPLAGKMKVVNTLLHCPVSPLHMEIYCLASQGTLVFAAQSVYVCLRTQRNMYVTILLRNIPFI